MKRVFVDTSALIAVMVQSDENHIAAADVWRDLVTREVSLVTTNYVVIETFAVLSYRFGIEAARKFVEDIVPCLNVEFVDEYTHNAGANVALQSGRQGPSIVDCVSFVAMRKFGINVVFAFDKRFSEQGFQSAAQAR